jgi:hypothetical protein
MRRILVGIAACAIVLGSPASATIACQGTVNKVGIEPNGDTYVYWGSWSTRICNPGQTLSVDRGTAGGGVTNIVPATCQSLTSMFLTAKALGKQVVVYIDQSSCTFTGGMQNPYPYYFEFLP